MKSIINTKPLLDSAVYYAAKDIKVFPVKANEKDPMNKNGFKGATSDLSVINGIWIKTPEANIGFATGQVNGVFVVDIDMKNGKDGEASLADLIAEHCDFPVTLEQKTPSGGRHLFFKCPNGVKVRTRRDHAPGIDIRGDGGYVVVAPSVYKGNKYEYVNDNDVAEAPEWLVTWINEQKTVHTDLAGSDGLVREGGRNAFIFELSLECNRDGLTIEETREIVSAANSKKCVPSLDDGEVNCTLASAYKYEAADVPAEVIEMNRKHAVVWLDGKCRVLKEVVDQLFGTADVKFATFQDIRDCYSNRFIEVEGKAKPLGAAWISHKYRREYDGVGFYPKGAPKGYYNLWSGFTVEPKEGDCSLYLNHIKENIANGDERSYDYIIAWMADLIQNPDKLVGTALVLRGSMGTGKGVFANVLGSLFGKHYMTLNNSGLLVGRFNGHMKDKVLLLADEAFWGGDKQAEGTLKNMVTEPILSIEEKGLNAYVTKNHLHMIFATNNDWAVPAGPQERRFFVIDVGEKRMQDTVYFKAIADQMDNGGREALLHYLMNYDLTDIDLRKYPQTAALWEQKIKSFTPVQKFWFHKLSTGLLDEITEYDDRYAASGWADGEIATKHLYQQYQRFVSELGVKHKTTPEELGLELPKLLPDQSIKKKRMQRVSTRDYYYVFPVLDECRKQFSKFMNYDIPWDIYADEDEE